MIRTAVLVGIDILLNWKNRGYMDNTEENFHNAAEDILYNLQHTYNCEPAAAACILLIALGRMGGMQSHFEKLEQAWEHMTGRKF